MNSVTLTGRLTKDIEVRKTQSNKSVVSFSLAVDKRFVKTNEDKTAFFIQCQAWNQTADFLGQYGTKGSKIGIIGELQTEEWEDNGQKRSKTFVNINNVELLGKPQNTGNQEQKKAPEQKYHQETITGDDRDAVGGFSTEYRKNMNVSDQFHSEEDKGLDINTDDCPFY